MSSTPDPRPIDPKTRKPLEPMPRPGYYPGFSTLSQRKFWDQKTRDVVLDRVVNIPPIRFFTEEEAETMKAITNRMLPQDDRVEGYVVQIVPVIDNRLYNNVLDGYRYEHMPEDREAFRLGIRAIDEGAKKVYGRKFVELNFIEQEAILKSLHDGTPVGAEDIWEKMPVKHFWTLLLQDCIAAYYAHPFAWDEIGYGGPAYPRAYMRLEMGQPEPWEVEEVRYAWEPPPGSLSTATSGDAQQYGSPGQGGSH